MASGAYQDTQFAYQGAGENAYQYPLGGIGGSQYGLTAGSGMSEDTGEVESNAQGVGGNIPHLDGLEGIPSKT